MHTVDLNADLGEGCGSDDELFRLVSSASISCGAHAGDEESLRTAIRTGLDVGVSIGAHPGYPDREGFGRRETGATLEEISGLMLNQLDAFAAACHELGAVCRHVKPHGALYNRAVADDAAAESIARAIAAFDGSLIVMCMPGSRLLQAAEASGLKTATEAFIDRAYATGTTLVPRSDAGAMITSPSAAASRSERIVLDHFVASADGTDHSIHAESLCVHGDNPNAAAMLRAARSRLEARGVVIAPFPK